MSDSTLLKNQTQTNTTIQVQSNEQSQQLNQQQTTQPQQQTANASKSTTDREQNLDTTIATVKNYMPPAYDSDIIGQLLASKRTILGDSGEMDNIKKAIRDVKGAMEAAGEKVYTAPEINTMINKYNTAIKMCDIYINHPKKDRTNHRYYLVTESRKKLFEDIQMLEKASDLILDGTWAGRTMTMRQMISEVSDLPLNKRISNAQRSRDYKEEFERAKAINPKMDEVGFTIYKKIGKLKKFEDTDIYRKEFEKGKDVWRAGNAMATFRDSLFMLRQVDFDEAGDPLSEVDRQNHEWNMKWFKAWEQDDFATREDMIAEQLPSLLDDIPMPPFALEDTDEKKLSNVAHKEKLATKMEEWLDSIGVDGILKIYQSKNMMSCISSLRKIHPSVDTFLKNNPVYEAKKDLLGQVNVFLDSYLKKKYGFQIDSVFGVLKYNKETEPTVVRDNSAREMNYASQIAFNYKKYYFVDEIQRVPFEKAAVTEEQQRRNAKRVRDIEIKRRCEDAAYENKRHKDAFEQKVAGMNMSAEEEKAYRAKLLDAKLDFQFAYAEMEVYMNRYNLKLNYKNNESRMLNRKKGQKDNLPLLSDEEAFEQVMSIDKDAPDYCSRVTRVLSDMNEKYDVSYKTMVTLENYKNMLERQITNEAALDIKRQRDMRLKAQAKQPASFDLPPISGVYQDKGQTYGQSCWARSGATIVNAMYTRLSSKDKSLKFKPIHDTYFLGDSKLDYNEEARLKVNEEYKEAMGDVNPKDDYLDNKQDILNFRTNPEHKSGNLFMMADYILKATDNRAMVKCMQFHLQGDAAKASRKLLQDEFLNRLSVILTKNGGYPVSVLNGGHYITVTGIKGRNLIYKDSASKRAPNKDFDTLSVDNLFSACSTKGLEIVWLEEIDDRSMKDVKEEFPEVEQNYEKFRTENQLDIPPEDYAHTKGVLFRKNIKKEDDPVLEGLITSKVYLPKGKPGEKVIFTGEEPQEAQAEQVQQEVQNEVQAEGEKTHIKKNLDVTPAAKAVTSTGQKSDNTETINKLRAEKVEVEKRVREDVGRLYRRQASEHDALRKLKDREEYTDKDGYTYPYLDKKFWFITTHKETRDEYIRRVSKLINAKYLEAVNKEKRRVSDVEQRINYYTDVNIVNTVDIEQIRGGYSEQSRQLMKKTLIAMAQNDLQREVSPKYTGKYRSFMDAVIKYGNMDVDYFYSRGLEGKNKRQEALEEEIKVYQDMVKALDELEKQVKKTRKADKNKAGEVKVDELDANVLDLIRGYRDMFTGMTGGNLQVKEGVEIIKVRGAYYNKDDVRVSVKPMKAAPLFPHEPAISDITQGHLGDCYFVSALASMVASDPALIKDCMKDNGDGTVTVRLMRPTIDRSKKGIEYNSEPLYFNVPKITLEGEGAVGSIWVNCMELAYQQYKKATVVRNKAISALKSKLSGDQKRRLQSKMNQLNEEISGDIEERFGESQKKTYEHLEDWQYVKEMEDFIHEDPQMAEMYRVQLEEEKLKEEHNIVDAKTISGGFAANVFSAFTGKVHKTVRMGYSVDRDKMNDLSFPYKNLREKVWTKEPIPELKAEKMKADSANASSVAARLRQIDRDIATNKSKIKIADDFLKQHPGKQLSQEKQQKYDGYKKAVEDLNAEREQNLEILKGYGFESTADYDKKKNEWSNVAEMEGLAHGIVEKFLANFDIKENLAEGEHKYKAFMTMSQMKEKLKSVDVNTLMANEWFNDAIEETLNKGETKQIYRRLEGIEDIHDKITSLAESLVKRFVLDAEKNEVLNYEHFSGNYSGEAEETFKNITTAIENHQAVVGGTFDFVADRAEMEENGEAVYDGIASTHEYSIIGVKTMTVNNPNYHKDGDERRTITHKFVRVRNPWASTHLEYVKGTDGKIKTVQKRDNSTAGVEEFELNDFMNRFDKVYYASHEDLRKGTGSAA